ncbi:MAG: ComEC/Rec2 family competence protein [Bacteroidetes bacterium]|nr:MAG: ComEC/Rec2 family competence protein [Bacteroidota bacterium]
MKLISNNPALKLLIIIILGIIVGSNYNINDVTLLYIIVIALILSIFSLLFRKKFLAYLFLGLTIGFFISAQLNQLSFKVPNKIIPTSSSLLEGRIVKTLKRTPYSYRCIVKGIVDHKALPPINNASVILNIKGLNKNPIELFAGTVLACPVKIRLPKKGVLPTDMNEQQYTASIDVQWIADATAKKVSIIRRNKDLNYYREIVVTEIEKKIDYLFSKQNFGIILALLTGDQTRVPQTLRREFSLTGTTHVLSVSGLHVGVIAAVLFILLGFIRLKWVKLLIFTVLVAAFVIMTGMQPPAIRAGIMAVIALLINTSQRRVSAINVISLSIILVIILDPGMIYSMGFQMSAAAMLGIAFLYNPFRNALFNLIKLDNNVSNYILSSIAITFSASLIVSPIVAYYFKVFSIISPIANIFIIPLYSIAMIFALMAVGLSYISTWLGFAYAASTDFLIDISVWLNKLLLKIPLSSLEGNITILFSILISLGLLYILLSYSRRQLLLRFGVSVFACFIALTLYNGTTNKREIKIYPRENYIAAIVPLNEYKTFVLLSDRKPSQYPARDYSMEKLILENPDSLVIGYTGNVGINISDHIKYKRKIIHFPLSLGVQNQIEKKLNLKVHLPQIIELDKD